MSLPPPQIIVKGGQDIDGSWGTAKTFKREFYFELINVPLPMFLISPLIPAYNSIHPVYPFALAKESQISKNIETKVGRGITVTTTYQILKPNKTLTGLSGWEIADVINDNLPHLLPAQDVTYDVVAVEETLDYLYVEKSEDEYNHDVRAALEAGKDKETVSWFREDRFQTTSGTKLTGTITRNILKMSFWYFTLPESFDEAELITTYNGAINADEIQIAGRVCPVGTVKIESIEVIDNTWERENVAPVPLKMIKVVLLLDNRTWNKQYENVSNLFMAYPYEWRTSESGKEDATFLVDSENQPFYVVAINDEPVKASPQRIFCTSFDPNPENKGDSTEEPIWVPDPKKAIQFFGTREDCFRLNPDSEPTEVTESMYLDRNGFVIYPDPFTGKVDTDLSPKIEGYETCPLEFSLLGFPTT
ncbi:MAG: hypothetical protein LBI05_00375 [Planctomycetaceae bacterium]|jgi:hypothetical protein|nr:hypothetical protein [Planctomycetaceae bacterium]